MKKNLMAIPLLLFVSLFLFHFSVMTTEAGDLQEGVWKRYLSEKAGEATIKDIMAELSGPGRDPRREFEAFSFAS